MESESKTITKTIQNRSVLGREYIPGSAAAAGSCNQSRRRLSAEIGSKSEPTTPTRALVVTVCPNLYCHTDVLLPPPPASYDPFLSIFCCSLFSYGWSPNLCSAICGTAVLGEGAAWRCTGVQRLLMSRGKASCMIGVFHRLAHQLFSLYSPAGKMYFRFCD